MRFFNYFFFCCKKIIHVIILVCNIYYNIYQILISYIYMAILLILLYYLIASPHLQKTFLKKFFTDTDAEISRKVFYLMYVAIYNNSLVEKVIRCKKCKKCEHLFSHIYELWVFCNPQPPSKVKEYIRSLYESFSWSVNFTK